MPSRHVTDHQMRLFMQFRQSDSVAAAAGTAAFSPATGHRIKADPRLPSVEKAQRERRRPDPLAEVLEAEILPLLEAAPGLRQLGHHLCRMWRCAGRTCLVAKQTYDTRLGVAPLSTTMSDG